MNRLLFLLLVVIARTSLAAAQPAENVILVTADGLRWQEVFRGADERLLKEEKFTPKDFTAYRSHQSAGVKPAREQLMPFFWSVLAKEGSVFGDRDHGSFMHVTNPWWFSYPGYNEILTGRADASIDSNDKILNRNVTVLEWLNGRPDFRGRVRAYASWDVFTFIINAERSGLVVNDGAAIPVENPTPREAWLNELQAQLPRPWTTVRHDALTQQYAIEALRSHRPRVLFVSFDETDDFAHDGKYHEYLGAAHRFDGFLKQLWDTVQANRAYRNRTVLLVTTDHGRGEEPLDAWQHHASKQAAAKDTAHGNEYKDGIVGSDQIWFAAIGPGIAAHGVLPTSEEHRQSQITPTLLRALGFRGDEFPTAVDKPMTEIFSER
jgi:hypothetical protein